MPGDDKLEEVRPEGKPPADAPAKPARASRQLSGKARTKSAPSVSRRKKTSQPKTPTVAEAKTTHAPEDETNGTSKKSKAGSQQHATKALPRLLRSYREEVAPKLMQEFSYTNPMQVPRVEKVVLNMGVGEAISNSGAMDTARRDLALISGQQPIVTRARKSIASFKLRAGQPVGTTVTLRGKRMWMFLDKLLNAALPRIRDFRGVSRTAFDGRGNYSLGIREQLVFPEIDYNNLDQIRSLQVNITTTALTDQEARQLLTLLGMPFAREPIV
jgi:large subunit ribosomal protein L5